MRAAMKQVDLIFDYFEKKYQAKYHKPSGVNRVREKWNVKSMFDAIGAGESREVIDYYFSLKRSKHDLTWMLYNYDRLLDAKRNLDYDRAEREKLREQTRQRAEQWRTSASRG
jgi:hypothetical protein